MPPKLTDTRLRILRLIARHGCPTAKELLPQLNMTRQALNLHVQVLRGLGLIETSEDRFAPLRLAEAGRALVGDGGFPVVGSIAAGTPIYADQDISRTVNRLDELLNLQEGDFFLEVRGDSMIGEGIQHGNLVAIRPVREVRDGEIAAVVLPGEGVGTLKRLYRKGQQIELHSANPSYPVMTFRADEVQVQGRYLGHVALGAAKRS